MHVPFKVIVTNIILSLFYLSVTSVSARATEALWEMDDLLSPEDDMSKQTYYKNNVCDAKRPSTKITKQFDVYPTPIYNEINKNQQVTYQNFSYQNILSDFEPSLTKISYVSYACSPTDNKLGRYTTDEGKFIEIYGSLIYMVHKFDSSTKLISAVDYNGRELVNAINKGELNGSCINIVSARLKDGYLVYMKD